MEREAEGELERVRRWKEKKTVTGAAHEAWQRLMTQRREGHRRHGYSGLSWWSHTVRSHMCAGAWLHRYSTLIALDKHPLALTASCVCLTLFLNSCSIKNAPLAHLKCGRFFPSWDVSLSLEINRTTWYFTPNKQIYSTSCHSKPLWLPLFCEIQKEMVWKIFLSFHMHISWKYTVTRSVDLQNWLKSIIKYSLGSYSTIE